MVWDTKQSECRYCGIALDMAAPCNREGEEHAPREGSVAMCVYCGGIHIHTADGRRKPTAAELRRLEHDPGVQRMARVVEAVQRARRAVWN